MRKYFLGIVLGNTLSATILGRPLIIVLLVSRKVSLCKPTILLVEELFGVWIVDVAQKFWVNHVKSLVSFLDHFIFLFNSTGGAYQVVSEPSWCEIISIKF